MREWLHESLSYPLRPSPKPNTSIALPQFLDEERGCLFTTIGPHVDGHTSAPSFDQSPVDPHFSCPVLLSLHHHVYPPPIELDSDPHLLCVNPIH